MNKIIFLLIITVFIFSCNSTKKNRDKAGDVITVSILPQKTFVEKIAGDDFKVNVLIPPGSSPAAYSLLPSQLIDIVKSAVWFRIGYIGFEYSWKDKIAQANSNMKVVDLSEGLDLIADKVEQHGDHIHMQGVDPHVWLSPTLVKQMARKIVDELSILKPEQNAKYEANYMKFAKEIDQINIEIKNKLKDFQGQKIIVFHPSLSYYARDFGIEQYSLETGGKEPTQQKLAEVVKVARKENLKIIYIQSEFDLEHARVFAEEIDGEIIQVWPLNPAWEENLMEMTNIFVENF